MTITAVGSLTGTLIHGTDAPTVRCNGTVRTLCGRTLTVAGTFADWTKLAAGGVHRGHVGGVCAKCAGVSAPATAVPDALTGADGVTVHFGRDAKYAHLVGARCAGTDEAGWSHWGSGYASPALAQRWAARHLETHHGGVA